MLLSIVLMMLTLQMPEFVLDAEESTKIVTINQLEFVEDSLNQFQIEDIRSLDSLFVTKSNFKPVDYNPQSAYWIRFRANLQNVDEDYVLEFYDQTIDEIDLYLSDNEKDTGRYYRMGENLPFQARGISHKNFQVRLEEGKSYSVYARIVNDNYADVRIAIRPESTFLEYALAEYFIYGLFYGMIVIISLYNILVFVAVKEIKYLYYTFYLLSVGFFALCVDGIGYQYIWPDSPQWNQVAHGIALFLIIFWFILFARKFLEIPKNFPLADKMLLAILTARTVLFLYSLLYSTDIFYNRNIEIVPLSLIFAVSIMTFRRGHRQARFFIVANGFLFLGFIFKALLMLSVIPFSILTYYSLHLSFVFEMLFLSLALSDRFRILKENRDLARQQIIDSQMQMMQLKDELNKELEEKIAERTEELHIQNEKLADSNLQLELQKKEISQINTLLDLDNWKLRNNLEDVQRKRLLKSDVSFQEFSQLFPDRKTCLKHLARMKWTDGFTCIRCGNQKSITGHIPYSRRCTRCSYVETPTVNTVFQGIRFPLEKAFYILYLMLHGDSDASLTELSRRIDLRKNTVWTFRKKVDREIQEHSAASLEIFQTLTLEDPASSEVENITFRRT